MTQHITFHHLGPADLARMLAVPEGLFDGPVDPVQAAAFLSDPGQEIVLACDAGLAVGMATGTVLLHPDNAPATFVIDVAVRVHDGASAAAKRYPAQRQTPCAKARCLRTGRERR